MSKAKHALIYFFVGLIIGVLIEVLSESRIVYTLFSNFIKLDIAVILNGGRTFADVGGIINVLTFPLSMGIYFSILSLIIDWFVQKRSQDKNIDHASHSLKIAIIFGLFLIITLFYYYQDTKAEKFREDFNSGNCRVIDNLDSRDLCYSSARQCNYINNSIIKDFCFLSLAEESKDIGQCNNIISLETENICLSKF